MAFMAEFPRRHAPATLRLKELIATRLGPPRLLFCHQRSRGRHAGQPAAGRWPRPSGSRHLVELVDWCRYVVDREPTWVTGVMHPQRLCPGRGRLPDDEPRLLGLRGAGQRGRSPRSVAAVTFPPIGRRPSPTARWPACRSPASGASPSSICPRRWSGSTRRAGTRNRWKASARWASSC